MLSSQVFCLNVSSEGKHVKEGTEI